MKRLLLFALALCTATAHALAQTPAAPAPQPGAPPKVTVTAQPAPPVKVEPAQFIPEDIFNRELKDLDGRSFSLADYRGRVFVINFWATWCGPCRLEIPELNKARAEYAARGVEFVGLTTENPQLDAERVRDFAREFKMEYKVGWADAETAGALKMGSAIPQTLVVAADGRIVTRFRGYNDKIVPRMLRDGIEKALNPSPPPATPAPSSFQSVPAAVFDAELKDADGAGFFMSSYRGRVFVLNLWATWCGPCRLEIPELNRIYKDYSGRGVEFVGLSTEDPTEDGERVRDFVSLFEMKYKVGFADRETALALLDGNNSIPQTLVVAADGHIVTRFRGYSNRMPPLVRRSIEQALAHGAEPPAPAADARPPAAAQPSPMTAAPAEPSARPRRAQPGRR
ncbi:MAG TPA: TlpA disulfide reductase family protein [Pyrinomonadaceae bacterium]